MIHYNIYFQQYDWEVEIYIILKDCCIEEIMQSLRYYPQSEIQQAFLNITTKVNSGFIKTFKRKSIIVINKPITLEEFVNILELTALQLEYIEDNIQAIFESNLWHWHNLTPTVFNDNIMIIQQGS